MMTEAQPHGAATRAMHWGFALLMLLLILGGLGHEAFPRGPARDMVMRMHFTLGVLVLGLAALRLVWRLVSPLPEPAGQPRWQSLAARAMHLGLLAMTVVLPVLGMLAVWGKGRSVVLFGGLEWPAPFAVPGGGAWGEVHEAVAMLVIAAIVAHAAAALWHQLVLKDGTLSRMLGRAG